MLIGRGSVRLVSSQPSDRFAYVLKALIIFNTITYVYFQMLSLDRFPHVCRVGTKLRVFDGQGSILSGYVLAVKITDVMMIYGHYASHYCWQFSSEQGFIQGEMNETYAWS